MDEYSWYQFLNFWCFEKDPIGSGLTIPFLMGIETHYGRGKDSNIETLISEVNCDFGKKSITIRHCPNLNMDVCCLDILGEQEKKYLNNIENIFFEVDDYNKIDSIRELQKVIKSEYMDYVLEEKYSLNKGAWTNFTDAELEIIKINIA